MSTYSVVQDKIGVQHPPYYLVALTPALVAIAFLSGVLSVSPVLWASGVLIGVLGLILDIHARRKTYDSWRPHILFWSTMLSVVLLSGGIAGIVVIPAYFLFILLA